MSILTAIPEKVGASILAAFNGYGSFFLYVKEVVIECFRGPFRKHLFFQQLHFIGNQSVFIVLLTSFFTGAVFALQIGIVFAIFRAEAIMGAATGKALTKELAPIMTAFLLAGRVGSAMTAEIATMKVNEQIDAMEAMAVNPISYLVVPRLLASMIMTPLLCGLFMIMGIFGAYVIGRATFNVDQGVFFEKIRWLLTARDIVHGLEKSFVFSIVIALVSCRFGLKAKNGARGVGLATTQSVVFILLNILAVDFVMTYFQIAH